MTHWKKIAFVAAILVVEIARTGGSALAHRFGVALVIPLSGPQSAQGRQYHEGFMLATTERDSHPDQESDGHLGGLDVYVSQIDAQGDAATSIKKIAARGEINIVAALGPRDWYSKIESRLAGTGIVMLVPGEPPFPAPDLPEVAAFAAAYRAAHNAKPSPQAAQGYNAARRIDAAVRALEGVDDMPSLREMFARSARNFKW